MNYSALVVTYPTQYLPSGRIIWNRKQEAVEPFDSYVHYILKNLNFDDV